jgi:hypothetical protein
MIAGSRATSGAPIAAPPAGGAIGAGAPMLASPDTIGAFASASGASAAAAAAAVGAIAAGAAWTGALFGAGALIGALAGLPPPHAARTGSTIAISTNRNPGGRGVGRSCDGIGDLLCDEHFDN